MNCHKTLTFYQWYKTYNYNILSFVIFNNFSVSHYTSIFYTDWLEKCILNNISQISNQCGTREPISLMLLGISLTDNSERGGGRIDYNFSLQVTIDKLKQFRKSLIQDHLKSGFSSLSISANSQLVILKVK